MSTASPLAHFAMLCQVTFAHQADAEAAIADSHPIIDGRRANCNLAAFGSASKKKRNDMPLGPGRMQGMPPMHPHSGGVGGFQQYQLVNGFLMQNPGEQAHNQGMVASGSGHASQYSPVIGAPVSANVPSVPSLDGSQLVSTMPTMRSASAHDFSAFMQPAQYGTGIGNNPDSTWGNPGL